MANENRFQITTRTGERINLDIATVKKYITNGVDITDSEYNMFFQLCKVNQVNPFLKEAYLIKFQGSPATIVLDYKVLQQIAEKNENYKGMVTGLIVLNKDGNTSERIGSYVLPNEKIIAGWCEVLRKDRAVNTKVYAMFDEFAAKKKDGTLNAQWATKPAFMITKVAKAQALREAFPNLIGSNIYTKEEVEDQEFSKPKNEKSQVVNNVIDLEEKEEKNNANFETEKENM